MVKLIHALIAQQNLIPKKSKVVVGLSGGPDSVFLLHFLCTELNLDVIAAHLDHEWRPDSHKDVAFCSELAKKYNAQFVDAKISALPISLKFDGSIEDVGRRARRFFFESICTKHKADLIAVAHHAQDQEETFFIRLVRGTSLTGLTGMQTKTGNYIRPLLTTNKRDIVAFLNKHEIPYLTDPSNESEDFLRNRIRKHVLPALRNCDDRFEKKFAQTIEHLRETEQFLELLSQKIFAQIATQKEKYWRIDIQKLLYLDPVLRHRVLIHWFCQEKVQFPVSRGFFNEVVKFLSQPNGGAHELHKKWKMLKKKGATWIETN